MLTGIPNAYESHLLECRSLSFVSTVHRGPWCSRLYTPPTVAQFLREVSLELTTGEICGVCGVTGSGKSTLLNVIATRARGSIGGTVLLDKQLLTGSRFRKMCSFVDVRTRLLPFLTVRQTIYYQMKLTLSGRLTSSQIEDRLLSLLNEWELLGYGHESVGDLSESSRRRLLLAIATAKDPVVLIADDPIRHLEPLSAYQLMLCLQSFVKRHRRMAVISLKTPRSDISQLLDRVTLLYYGETVYSGLTSKLPLYMHQLGFLCPPAENPVSYLISLVTLDRETSTRFAETQEQAIKLIEAFRGYHPATNRNPRSSLEPLGLSSTVALCNGSRPGRLAQINILFDRTINCTLLRLNSLFWSLIALPIFVLFYSMFTSSIHNHSYTVPHSMALQMSLMTWIITITSGLSTIIGFNPVRQLLYVEAEERLYPSFAVPIIYLSVVFLPHFLGLSGATAIFFWGIQISSLSIIFQVFSIFLGCLLIGQFITVFLMLFIRRSYTVFIIISTVFTFSWAFSGGILRSHSTLSDLPDWVGHLALAFPFRYANRALIEVSINQTIVNDCRRNERQEIDNTPLQKFCRWATPIEWINDSYPTEYIPKGFRQNLILFYLFAFGSFLLLILAYFSSKFRPNSNKFKYK